jgi:hypothetical protein
MIQPAKPHSDCELIKWLSSARHIRDKKGMHTYLLIAKIMACENALNYSHDNFLLIVSFR